MASGFINKWIYFCKFKYSAEVFDCRDHWKLTILKV